MKRTLELAACDLRGHVRARGWVAARGALVLLLLVGLPFAMRESSRIGAAGLTFFRLLVVLDVAFLTAIAIGPFASSLAEEKEGDTLGVLRLAGLSPGGIVLAKVLGLLAATLLLLAVQTPFGVLATSLGGLGHSQVAGVLTILVGYTVAAQGIALAAAGWSRDPKQAGTRTGQALAVWLLLPWLVDAVIAWLRALATPAGGGGGPASTAVTVPSSLESLASTLHGISPLSHALDVLAGPGRFVWPPVVLCGATALLGYALAVAGVARGAGRPPAAERRRRLPRIVGVRTRALVWKEENFLLGGARRRRVRRWAYIGLFALLGVLSFDPRGGWLGTWSTLGTLVFFVAAFLETGVAASHLYREELRERTLFGLLLLPLPPMTWAAAKAEGALRVAHVPLVLLGVSLALGIMFGEPQVGALLAGVGVAVVTINLTLYLSLWLPRGAFVVSAALMLFPAMLLLVSGPAQLAFCCGCAYVAGPLAIVFVGWLQVQIGKRLRVLGAQA